MKDVFSWISLYLTGLAWFVTASLFALFAVINPDTLKTTLSESNTYQKIVPAALDEAQKQSAKNGTDQVPVNEPAVRAAANKAFPPKDLQNKSEAVIDSLFAWLEGKTPEPEFRLDFTSNKQILAAEIGNYAENRAESLPPCTIADLQAARTQDVFTIKCLPPGVAPSQVGREATQKITNNENFLKDPIVTSQTIKTNNGQTGSKSSDLEPLRNFYQQKPLLSWLLPVLVIILAVGGVLLATDRLRAVKRLGRIFLMAAVSLGIIAAILKFASSRTNSSPTPDKISNDIALPIVGNLLGHIATVYIWLTIISLALGLGLLLTRKYSKLPLSSK